MQIFSLGKFFEFSNVASSTLDLISKHNSSSPIRLTSDIYLSVTGWRKKRFSRLNSCFSPRFVGVISFKYRLITSENNVSGCNPCDCNSIFFSSSAPHFMLHWRNFGVINTQKYIKILKKWQYLRLGLVMNL